METNAQNVTSTKTSEAADGDIVEFILEDHKPLKELIKTLKDSEAPFEERQTAYDDFSYLLVAHAKPEEETLYVAMKNDPEVRAEGLEGEVEHQIADQLLEEINRTEDEDLWTARVKVLAELVEHHIEEEEEELLPDFKKRASDALRANLAESFLRLKTQYFERGGVDAPREADLQLRH